jgi:cell division protease FtsH
MALMQVCFGGRIAEQIFCDDISSGAHSDIMQATRIAKQMVSTWGMSDKLGPISFDGNVDMNRIYFVPNEKDYSERTAEEIDTEVKKLVDEAYKKAKDLILANKDKLEGIAQSLLKYETLDAEDVKLILEGKELNKPTVADLLESEQAKKDEENKEQQAEPEEKKQ